MEYRLLGGSGLRVPVLSLGTGTFGGGNEFFKAWGQTDVAEATRLVDICLDAGLNMFDSADGYSAGAAEEILGQSIKGKRNRIIISTKATFRFSDAPNDVGSSRFHLINAVEKSLPNASAPNTSISFSSTPLTPSPPSRKSSPPSMSSSAPEKSATSAVPISPAGIS